VREVYRYLAKGSLNQEKNTKNNITSSSDRNVFDLNDIEESIYNDHFRKCGFLREDVDQFTLNFHKILQKPHLASELFEKLIDDINTTLSGMYIYIYVYIYL
jgi:hypothetical protein